MGSVWLVEHIALGRRAALKMLHPEFSDRAEIVTRFFNEARAATTIADPGIVQIFDFGQHVDGRAYIVMELLDGEPLDRRLAREGALHTTDALRIMRQVASTLAAAHARGIIHRDLKPENIFIVRDPEVPGGERAKVLDFGIAKLAGVPAAVRTQTAAVMGTPTYMSPEQCRGAGQVDPRSDIYALGCVLFALLVGRPPFQADGMGDVIAMHLREPAPPPSELRPGIPPDVDRLVLCCLAKDPARRFAGASELAAAIGALLGPALQLSPVSASGHWVPTSTTLSATTGVRATQPPRQSRAGMIAVVAGLGIAGVAIGLISLGRGDVRRLVVVSEGATPEGAAPPAGAVPPRTTPPFVAASPRADAPASAPAPPSPSVAVEGLPPQNPPNVAQVAPVTPVATSAQVAPILRAVLVRFVAWSHDHAGAACPDASALGAPGDPWGRPLAITCTDQPLDQIAGAISSGPDGQAGTADDIASWQLGQDVTDVVRGARWRTTPQLRTTSGPERPERQRSRLIVTPPKSPPTGARGKPAVELDENGLPVSR